MPEQVMTFRQAMDALAGGIPWLWPREAAGWLSPQRATGRHPQRCSRFVGWPDATARAV